jgi:hypothetical protein
MVLKENLPQVNAQSSLHSRGLNSRCLTAKQLSVSRVPPCQRRKDNLSKLERIFTALLLALRIPGLMEALARRNLIRRLILLIWKINL